MTMEGNSGETTTGKGDLDGNKTIHPGSERRTAIVVGVLFITATVAGFVSAGFLGSIMEAEDYLAEVHANETSFMIGAFAIVVMGLAGAGIGIFLYPVLRRYNEGMALGSAGLRMIEGAVFCVSAVFLLRSIALSQAFVDAGSPEASYFQTLGELSVNGLDYGMVVGGLAFSVAALLYYWVFYQTKLIPRWLSVFGLIAVLLTASQTMLTFFDGGSSSASDVEVLHLPIFVQEMILAIWLIAKGFDVEAIAALDGQD
jgi:hypothetical protein